MSASAPAGRAEARKKRGAESAESASTSNEANSLEDFLLLKARLLRRSASVRLSKTGKRTAASCARFFLRREDWLKKCAAH